MTITHGILSSADITMLLFRKMIFFIEDTGENYELNPRLKDEKINWNKTEVFDNSNRGKRAIYKVDWK